MSPDLIQQFLGALGNHHIETHGQWLHSPCLFAPWKHGGGKDVHPSFGIKSGDGRSHYYCFSCNSGGSLEELLMQLSYLVKGADFIDKDRYDFARAYKLLEVEYEKGYTLVGELKEFPKKEEQKQFVPWPESYWESFIEAKKSSLAMDYLQSRGFPMEHYDHFTPRFDPLRGAVVFPVRTVDGALGGIRGRYLIPVKTHKGLLRYHDYDWKEYNNTFCMFFHEREGMFDSPLVLCEGVFDVFSIFRAYGNVITSMSTGFTKQKLERLSYAVELVCFFDNDKAGEAAYLKLKKDLPHVTVRKVDYLPYMNPLEKWDAGRMTKEEIQQILSNAGLV